MAIGQYILKRILYALFVIWLVATTVFFALRAIPGGPVSAMLGANAPASAIRELRTQLGLNRPMWVQYLDWMTDLVFLDLGRSIRSGQKITVLIGRALPRTASIGAIAILVGLSIAIPAGIISAVYKGKPVDYVATVGAFLGLSMPSFFTAILLAILFGVHFDLLPIVGYTPIKEGYLPWFKSIVLAGIAAGLPYAAVIMRMTRSSFLEVMDQQYMKTARAKGVSWRKRLYKHAMQNAMIPIVTVTGIQLVIIIVAAVTVELVFGIRGIGRLLVSSILQRDYPIAQAIVMLIATIMVFMNLTVDIVYTFLDPRIRYEGREA